MLKQDGLFSVNASPSTRRLAREKSIALEKFQKNYVSADDLRQIEMENSKQSSFTEIKEKDFTAFGPVKSHHLSRIKQITGERLANTQKTIPSVTHHEEAEITEVEKIRKELSLEFNVKITSLVFHIKALVMSLKKFPFFASSLGQSGQLILKAFYHVGIAMETPKGLTVPVIRDADRKGLLIIAKELKNMAERARKNKLSPDEMIGAVATISNLGGIGGASFSPIINPPEVCILGISKSTIKPVWQGDSFQPVLICPLDLTYDHRVIDGAEAARFMHHYMHLIKNPALLVL